MVKRLRGALAHSLAIYAMDNDDLEAAKKFFEEAAETRRGLGDWFDYLAARSRATRCSMLQAGSLEDLKNGSKMFEEIWMEAEERVLREGSWAPTAPALEKKAAILAEYLVHLALEGRGEEVSRLLSEKGWLFTLFPEVGVATLLLLRILGAKVEEPEPWEIAKALEGEVVPEFRPAFNVLMGSQPIEYAEESCKELEGGAQVVCLLALAAVLGHERAADLLKSSFLEGMDSKKDLLQELAQRYGEQEIVERFRNELKEFVEKRGVSDVLLLPAPNTSLARMVLMLWALSRRDGELARAHAKLASVWLREKLPRRLFREAAEASNEEEFRLPLLKLFYLHI